MQQHTLKPKKGATHRGRRRGIGDTFAGRGVKGQQSRVGGRSKFGAGFEGGQISILRRMPKLGGFRNINRIEFQPVNLSALEKLSIDKISCDTLLVAGLIRSKNKPVKILGFGKLTRKLTCFVDAISKSAKTEIEKASGSVELPKKKEVIRKVKKTVDLKK